MTILAVTGALAALGAILAVLLHAQRPAPAPRPVTVRARRRR